MKRCGRCQATILSSELVMRARELVFHVHCFSCAVCSTLLTKGDTFGMREGAVLCRLHYTELPPPSPPQLHHHHPFHPQMEPPSPRSSTPASGGRPPSPRDHPRLRPTPSRWPTPSSTELPPPGRRDGPGRGSLKTSKR
ncbi:hypothetical protein AAG570_004400 [Ranatra chinensis]|uniref:LIM zinc-binding domain-containing protein n=1 Tax=Ranatra chinensis TaxID=642074 RepID=A0ABD0Y1K6_9HEMI